MLDFLFGSAFFDNRLTRIILAIAVLAIIQMVVNHFIGRLVEKAVRGHHYKSAREEKQREDTLIGLFRTALTVILWIIGIIFILQEFGVNLAALATGAGLIGIVVGFGAQSMIKDFLSGMFIILENQYRVGDVVTIGGHSGLVENVTIRMTKLRDLDGSVYFVPNGEITTVRNMTLEYSGVIIEVGISYDSDVEQAKKLIDQVGRDMAEDADWKDRIIEPITFLRLDSFGDSSVNLMAVGKTVPIEQWNVAGEYRTRLKRAFDKNGVEIPFPQRVVHYAKEQKSKK